MILEFTLKFETNY